MNSPYPYSANIRAEELMYTNADGEFQDLVPVWMGDYYYNNQPQYQEQQQQQQQQPTIRQPDGAATPTGELQLQQQHRQNYTNSWERQEQVSTQVHRSRHTLPALKPPAAPHHHQNDNDDEPEYRLNFCAPAPMSTHDPENEYRPVGNVTTTATYMPTPRSVPVLECNQTEAAVASITPASPATSTQSRQNDDMPAPSGVPPKKNKRAAAAAPVSRGQQSRRKKAKSQKLEDAEDNVDPVLAQLCDVGDSDISWINGWIERAFAHKFMVNCCVNCRFDMSSQNNINVSCAELREKLKPFWDNNYEETDDTVGDLLKRLYTKFGSSVKFIPCVIHCMLNHGVYSKNINVYLAKLKSTLDVDTKATADKTGAPAAVQSLMVKSLRRTVLKVYGKERGSDAYIPSDTESESSSGRAKKRVRIDPTPTPMQEYSRQPLSPSPSSAQGSPARPAASASPLVMPPPSHSKEKRSLVSGHRSGKKLAKTSKTFTDAIRRRRDSDSDSESASSMSTISDVSSIRQKKKKKKQQQHPTKNIPAPSSTSSPKQVAAPAPPPSTSPQQQAAPTPPSVSPLQHQQQKRHDKPYDAEVNNEEDYDDDYEVEVTMKAVAAGERDGPQQGAVAHDVAATADAVHKPLPSKELRVSIPRYSPARNTGKKNIIQMRREISDVESASGSDNEETRQEEESEEEEEEDEEDDGAEAETNRHCDEEHDSGVVVEHTYTSQSNEKDISRDTLKDTDVASWLSKQRAEAAAAANNGHESDCYLEDSVVDFDSEVFYNTDEARLVRKSEVYNSIYMMVHVSKEKSTGCGGGRSTSTDSTSNGETSARSLSSSQASPQRLSSEDVDFHAVYPSVFSAAYNTMTFVAKCDKEQFVTAEGVEYLFVSNMCDVIACNSPLFKMMEVTSLQAVKDSLDELDHAKRKTADMFADMIDAAVKMQVDNGVPPSTTTIHERGPNTKVWTTARPIMRYLKAFSKAHKDTLKELSLDRDNATSEMGPVYVKALQKNMQEHLYKHQSSLRVLQKLSDLFMYIVFGLSVEGYTSDSDDRAYKVSLGTSAMVLYCLWSKKGLSKEKLSVYKKLLPIPMPVVYTLKLQELGATKKKATSVLRQADLSETMSWLMETVDRADHIREGEESSRA